MLRIWNRILQNIKPDERKIQFQQKMKEQLRKVENLRKYQKLVQSQNGRIKVVMERIRKENIRGFHVSLSGKLISLLSIAPSKKESTVW